MSPVLQKRVKVDSGALLVPYFSPVLYATFQYISVHSGDHFDTFLEKHEMVSPAQIAGGG